MADASRGAVVVLSWFGCDDTLACVASLVEGDPDLDVLVIDNGSYDGVLERVAERWPGVHRMQTGENLGFAGGMNAGLRWALERGAAFVTVLNNDTVVPPGAIEALQRTAGDGMAVSPEVRYLDRPDEVWFGAGAIDARTLLPHHVRAAHLQVGTPLRPTTVLAGACVTASAAAWRRAGLFDERFFLNFEDSEWSVRATRRGVALAVDPRIRIGHAVSASFAKASSRAALYYFARNGLLWNRIAGGSPLSRLRFLRTSVVHDLGERVRADGVRAGLGAAVVMAVACLHDATRRYGPAPAWIARRRRGDMARGADRLPS